MSTSRQRAIRTAAIALPLIIAAGCKGKTEQARAETGPAAVTIGTENILVVKTDTIRTGPSLSGTLTAERSASIRAQVGGTVLRTFAEQGQRVGAGQQLAEIDQNGIRDQFLSARSGLTSAQNSADIAQRELERAQKLYAAGAIAERDLDNAKRGNVAAQAQLADARARLANSEETWKRTRITAPFSGIVSERQVSAGDVVAPGGALFTVIDPTTMRLEASVPADQLGAVRVGSPVSFSVTGYPGRTFTGRVTRVNPVVDPATRQVRIYATIPNAGATLVGGLFAEGRVASEARSASVIPLAAVDERGLRPSVMQVKAGKVVKTEVLLGLRDEASERVEVASGLQPGDTVLLGAARGISAGTPVKVSVVADRK